MQRAAPEDWYRIERVGHDVTHISEPFIREFYRCNMWHVRGRNRDLLVDSGMGVVSLRAWVPLVTEKQCLAVASHTHFDHIGCHHEFSDRLVHGAEAELLARPTRAATLVEPYVSDEIFTRLPPEPYRSASGATTASATGKSSAGGWRRRNASEPPVRESDGSSRPDAVDEGTNGDADPRRTDESRASARQERICGGAARLSVPW